MQDKEFDDLLRSKLDNFELTPSTQVWQNIAAGSDRKKNEKSIFPRLGIAASIIILIAAAILFIPKKATNNSANHHYDKLAHNQAKQLVTEPENIAPVKVGPAKDAPIADIQVPVKEVNTIHYPKTIAIPAAQNKQDVQLPIKTMPVKTDEQPVFALVADSGNGVKNLTVQAIEIPGVVKQSDTIPHSGIQTQPVLASTQTPAVKQNKPVVKKRGIHNIGDLVNLVVAKVDKRKDKLITFKETDDDGSTITGLHIGAINIKRDE